MNDFSRQVYRQAWREHDLKWMQANVKAKWHDRHKQYIEVRKIIAKVMTMVSPHLRQPTLLKALTLFWQSQKLTKAVRRNLRELDAASVK